MRNSATVALCNVDSFPAVPRRFDIFGEGLCVSLCCHRRGVGAEQRWHRRVVRDVGGRRHEGALKNCQDAQKQGTVFYGSKRHRFLWSTKKAKCRPNLEGRRSLMCSTPCPCIAYYFRPSERERGTCKRNGRTVKIYKRSGPKVIRDARAVCRGHAYERHQPPSYLHSISRTRRTRRPENRLEKKALASQISRTGRPREIKPAPPTSHERDPALLTPPHRLTSPQSARPVNT